MESIIFSLTKISPIFIIIGIGALVRYAGLTSAELCDRLTRLVFFVFLPSLLLRSVTGLSSDVNITLKVFFAILLTMGITFLFAWILSTISGRKGIDRGMFAAGSCWGNVAIIGYALAEAIYGEVGLQRAVLFSGIVLPSHMVIGYASMGRSLSSLPRKLSSNPIILSLLCGYIIRFFSIPIPGIAMNIFEILSRASLPLALMAIGGSLEFTKTRQIMEPLALSAIKLLAMPVFGFTVSLLLGLERGWTGSIVVGFSCPVAVSFFVVSRSLGVMARRGAAIVTATHIIASVSTGIIAALLRAMDYV